MSWLTLAVTIAGIVSTLIAYAVNPQRRKDELRRQLVHAYQQIEIEERKRDEALQKNDADALTIVTANIIKLRQIKADIFQQLGQN